MEERKEGLKEKAAKKGREQITVSEKAKNQERRKKQKSMKRS